MRESRHRPLLEAIASAALSTPGDSDPALRRAAHEAARQPDATVQDLPDDLARFVGKVARDAYRVTDDDVEALRASGWSDDALFELIVATASGAGLARLEHGLAALEAALA